MEVLILVFGGLLIIIVCLAGWGVLTFLANRRLTRSRANLVWKIDHLEQRIREIANERDTSLTETLVYIFRRFEVVVFGPIEPYGLAFYATSDKDATIGIAVIVPPRQLKRWLLYATGLSMPLWRVDMSWAQQLYQQVMQDREARAIATKATLKVELDLMRTSSLRGTGMLDIYLVPRGLLEDRNLIGFWDSLRGQIVEEPHSHLKHLL